MEKKRKKKGGSNWEKNGENEKKINCPFDDKKVCPVTLYKTKLSARGNSGGFLLTFVENIAIIRLQVNKLLIFGDFLA